MWRLWVGLLAGCTSTASLTNARIAGPREVPTGLRWQCDRGLEIALVDQQLLVRTNTSGDWWFDHGWPDDDGLHFYAYQRGPRHAQDFGWEFVVPTAAGADAVRRIYLATTTSTGIATDKPRDIPLVEEPCWAPDGPTVAAAREKQLAPADVIYHHATRFASATFPKAKHFQLRACWTADDRRSSQRLPSLLPNDAWVDDKLHFAWLGGTGFTVESQSETYDFEIGETGFVVEARSELLTAKVYPKLLARNSHPHELTCEYGVAR